MDNESEAIEVKYPRVTVNLSGTDGNVFSLMGKVLNALRRAQISPAERDKFREEIMSASDYDHALRIVLAWVNVT